MSSFKHGEYVPICIRRYTNSKESAPFAFYEYLLQKHNFEKNDRHSNLVAGFDVIGRVTNVVRFIFRDLKMAEYPGAQPSGTAMLGPGSRAFNLFSEFGGRGI